MENMKTPTKKLTVVSQKFGTFTKSTKHDFKFLILGRASAAGEVFWTALGWSGDYINAQKAAANFRKNVSPEVRVLSVATGEEV